MRRLASPPRWQIAATALALAVISSASCEACEDPMGGENFDVLNETDQTVVVEYVVESGVEPSQVYAGDVGARETPYEKFRLPPGQRGYFRPQGDSILDAPFVVRTVPDGRIVARAPVGFYFGNRTDLVVG